MRIGELAALVGVTTRTVRHYYHLGLLPEPERTAGGYRENRLRDAVLLARVRRLAELGLSLDEVRDVLADDRGNDLREVLGEQDGGLARQPEAIAAGRARLAVLLEADELRPDSAVSPAIAMVLRDLALEGSRIAEMDREMLSLMEASADLVHCDEIVAMLRPLAEPGMRVNGH